MADYISRNVFNGFIIFLIVLNVLPFVAPIASYLGIDLVSTPIYGLYSFMCHQFYWRSIHVLDHKVAWCSRDTFIWLGFLAVALAVRFNYIKSGLKWYWIVPFTIPIAMDGGIQTIATLVLGTFGEAGVNANEQFYFSTNFMRMITGGLFGLGLSAILSPFLYQESLYAKQIQDGIENPKTESEKSLLTTFLKLGSLYISLIVLYITLVFVWRITSPEYPPQGYLDHVVRIAPPTVEQWVDKRWDHT
jgi:uncharacterized membrane protein